jgi:hypothetical protein
VNKRTARGTGETGLTAAQIERLQAAIKEVTYGKLIITIQDNKILGYVVEKSEKFA